MVARLQRIHLSHRINLCSCQKRWDAFDRTHLQFLINFDRTWKELNWSWLDKTSGCRLCYCIAVCALTSMRAKSARLSSRLSELMIVRTEGENGPVHIGLLLMVLHWTIVWFRTSHQVYSYRNCWVDIGRIWKMVPRSCPGKTSGR